MSEQRHPWHSKELTSQEESAIRIGERLHKAESELSLSLAREAQWKANHDEQVAKKRRLHELYSDSLTREQALKDELRLSYPKTPVDCLLSTLSELQMIPPNTVGAAIRHVMEAVAECRGSLQE